MDYIFRWLGSRFLSPDDRATLGLIDRSAIVADAPASSQGSAAIVGTVADDGPSSSAEAVARPEATTPAAEPTPAPEADKAADVGDTPTATAVAASPVEAAPSELTVIATNGHANGHAANGNGNGAAKAGGNAPGVITLNLGQTKVSFQTQADAPSCADCGSIMVRNGSCYKCLNCGSTSGCS